ncbi:hypothetical protein V8C86DRAFT_2685230 [Haematococcus lacustris]
MASSLAAHTLLVVMLLTAASSCSSSVVCRRSLQQECPIPTTTVLNLTSAAAQCVTSLPNFCAGCICGLFSALAPSLASAGVFASAAEVGNVTAAASAGTAALSACVTSFMGQFTTADVNLGSIMALNSCPFTIVPQCLVDQLCPLVNCNFTTSAPIPGAASPLSPASWLPLALALAAAGLLNRML